MSGLSKKYRWRKLIWVFGLIYIVVVMCIILILYNIPYLYDIANERSINEVLTGIETALQQPNNRDIVASLEELKSQNSMDIVVLAPEETIYATLPETDFNYLQKIVNTDMLSYQSSYIIRANNIDYQVWVATYKVTPQRFFVIIIAIIGATIIVLCGIMAVLIFLMFKKLLNPLQRLRSNIVKLREYRLAEIQAGKAQSEYDALSEELNAFTGDLQDKMVSINDEYTVLERTLEALRELNATKTRLAGALIHNLKTPLNIAVLQTEQLEKLLDTTPEQKAIIQDLVNNNSNMMEEVNEILKVINLSNIDTYMQKERVEVIQTVREMLRLFLPLFKERQIQFEFDAPQEVFTYMNRIELKQIIHNILSNATQYTDTGGLFQLAVIVEKDAVLIEAYNDKQEASKIDFSRAFDLFYYVDKRSYSSGVGLFTVKSMVENNGGWCTFSLKDDGVILTISLPVKKESDFDENIL